jgi:6-pyruvoyl-tetrahydropterin synthase related domain
MNNSRVRQWLSQADLGLLAALAFACVSAWPMLSRSSLPILTDAHHHIYRTFEIIQAWQQGILFTRWAPDFYFSYGYPVFNFYAPFTHYLSAAYGWFFGAVAGVKFSMVLSAFIGTTGVYLFGREHWGALPAAVSAAVYASAPYIALTEPITRGAMPEAFAIGMGPVVLWAFTRLGRTGSRRFFALAAVSLAILIASHNLLSFVLIAFTAAWILWDIVVLHRPTTTAGWVEALARPAAAGLLAVGLTAMIWLPAILEGHTVQYAKAFAYPPFNRYTAASALLAPATTADAHMFDASELPYRIGVAQWVFGLLGALTLLRPGPQRRVAVFFALVSVVTFGMMIPQSDPIWQVLRVLPYLQFSYRLLGVLVPCLAWLAGALVAWVAARRPNLRLGAASIVAGLSLLAAVPLLTPLPWPEFGPVTPKAIYDLELSGVRGVGTTNDGEFLPITVLNKPSPNPAITAAVKAGTIEKVDRAALPANTDVTLTGHNTLQDDFAIQAPDTFVLRVLTFYWAGWTAYLDGARVPIQVTNPEGFISVAVPAGSHSLRLRLEETPTQRLGWIISAAALVLLLGLLLAPVWRVAPAGSASVAPAPGQTLPAGPIVGPRPLVQRRGVQLNAPTQPSTQAETALAAWPAVALLGLAAATLLIRVGWDVSLTWHAAHDQPQVAGAQVQRFTRFDDGLALEAYDFPATQARPGDKLNLTFYWEVTRPTQQEASVFVHFYGPNGALFGQADKPDPVLNVPTNRWALGLPRVDQEIALIRTDAPPGVYAVAVGLWDRATGRRSLVLDENGQPTKQDKLVLTNQFTILP